MSNSKLIKQTSTTSTTFGNMNNYMTSLHAFSMQYTESSSSNSKDYENKENYLPISDNKELLEEQKKQYKEKGHISDKYLVL